MTHYVAMVLVRATAISHIDEEVARLLAPYDENLQVKPYPVKCECGRYAQRSAAHEYAEAKGGKKFQQYRDEYWAKPPKERSQKAWERHTAPFLKLERQYKRRHPQKPNPECEDCHGTGTRMSTYNPKSRWDWYSIGGRWSDLLPPANMVFAKDFIATTRKNMQEASDKYYRQHPDKLPKSGKFPRAEVWSPSNVVTPRGRWIEFKKYGWWGIVTRQRGKQSDWNRTFRQLMKKYSDCYAVVVDCHI